MGEAVITGQTKGQTISILTNGEFGIEVYWEMCNSQGAVRGFYPLWDKYTNLTVTLGCNF